MVDMARICCARMRAMLNDNILLSRKLTAQLAGVADVSVQSLISRGRLTEVDALIGDTVRKGVTLRKRSRLLGLESIHASTRSICAARTGSTPTTPRSLSRAASGTRRRQ